MKYRWKPGSRMRVDADIAGKRMTELYREHGVLTTDLLKQDAVDKDSPIRKCFEWDDETAADRFRTVQAYEMLRFITYIPETESDEEDIDGIRLFFPIYREVETEDEKGEDGKPQLLQVTSYRSTPDILRDPNDRKQLLNRALGELRSFKKKYKLLKELKPLFHVIDNLMN